MAGILDELRAEVEREKALTPQKPKKKSALEELREEVGQEPRKESELERIRREVDVNPESLRTRRAEGQKLTDEQQKIAFEAERSRGLWDMAKGYAKAFPGAAYDAAKKLVLGTKEYLQESAPALGSALATAKYSQMPTPENLAVAEELRKKQEAENARAWNAQRSAASGIATDIEETANAAVRGAFFGTSITDLAAEKLGLIAKEKSFNNYLARESMREQERQSVQEYPDRASFLLSESPLADVALDVGAALQGGTAQEQIDRADVAKKFYREGMLEQAASFKPNENISAAFESFSPISIPAKLVKPFTKLTTGTMETAGGLALRAVTKPTIKGVNPLEGVGLGINWVGDKSETLGKALSRAVTGTEDTAISGLISTPVKTATYLPGKILTGTGRTMRDLGRQIDAGGIRGRTGLLERLGRDPASADFLRDMFGPGSQKSAERLAKRNAKRLEAGKAPIEGKTGGIARARAADWTLRMANNLAQTGTSGAVLNGIIGAADLETAEEFGRATGTGFGIGAVMGANVPGRIEAAFDPTTSFAEKVDKILEINPEDRRRDEDADLVRFRATTDTAVKEKVDKIADPNSMIAARERELNDLFQLKAEADYREEDTAVLDQNITIKMDELNKLKQDIANLSPEELAERKRAVELIVLDAFDSLKTNGRAAGLNGVDIQILESSDFEPFLRAKWGKNLTDAEAIVAQLDGKADLSPSEIDTLGRAKATVQQFQRDVTEYSQQLGFGLSESGYDTDTPAHLRMSNIGAPTLGINAEVLLRDPNRVGLRYLLQHEGQHVLENFKEVQELQRPIRELFFGRKRPTIDPATGQVIGEEIQPGIITDEWLDTTGVEVYGRKFGGVERFKSLFGGSLDRQREYLRKEVMADLSGLSESRYGSVRDALDSTGQALIDRVLVARKNSLLGRIRSALYSLGVEIDSNGGIQSLLFEEQLGLSPEALALMRQFKRAQRDLTDTLTYTTTGPENQVEIPITELMTNRGLQEAYKDDVIWEKEQVLAVFDDAGNQISEIVIPPGTADSALDEYRMRGGKLVDENGNELTLSPEINIQAIPDGSRVSIDTRIARNPDGSPKILSNKEIKARARQRNQMIRDAIDNAPEDGSGTRLRDTGNGSYRGTLSPTQLQAIMALPNDVVPPSLKRNTAVFNELLQKGDGSRVLMEYQPALRGGRYRALAPKIRDVVPIGFQFSKDGNFLATTISVSRMFDKMNAWAQKKPDNLNLWGRDLTRFWDDVRIVLDNHNRGFKAEGVDPKDGTMKGTPLDQDPEIALQKKNRINDFFNLFNKDTEGLNPSRTKLPVRRGQDSADRIIMSARMDRINQLQVSNSEKLPVDYGKMTVNFMPADQTVAEDLTNLDIENDMELEDEARGASAAQFLPGIRYTELPDDPKKLMADFYMLNAMLTTPPTGWNLGKFGGESTMYAPSKDPTGRYAGARAEVYEDALQQAKQTLIPRLHEKIQKALHFAVAAELRHALSRKQPTELASSEFWQEYARQYAVQGSSIPDLKKGRAPRRFKNESGGYQDSFVAMESARKKLGMSVADVARFAEQMFRTGAWSQSYGGTPWGDIAQHLAQMSDPNYSTERVRAVVTDENGRMQVVETDEFRNPGVYNQMFQEIDRAYDLQHNTNTVFNKIKKYSQGSEGYRWIAKMLDFKANIGNPRELQKYTSGTMRNLANAWLGDMRADAPTTQDLEERVKAQLPDKLVENLDPDQFIEVLKDRVGDFYRKRTSGVVREDPYESIRNEAENIYRKKHSGTPKNNEWNDIKKDQNAHIGIILDDHFGDIGIARTDAVKLFRMLLAEGKDPQVTGKTPPPKIEQPLVQGLKAMGPKEISNAADAVVSTSNMSPENSGADIGGYKVFLKKDKSGYFVLMAAPKTESGAIGSSFVLNWLKVKDVNNPTIKTKISEVLASFQKDVLKKEAGAGNVPTPASATPSSQYFIGQKFVPNKNKSVPTNLFEFAKEAMGVKGINGVQIGDITLVSAGANKANDVTFKIYQGDSVAEKDLIGTIIVPSPVADLDKNLADWLAEYAETKAEQAGYTSVMGWMAQDLSKSMKPTMSKGIKEILNKLETSTKPGSAAANAAKNYLNYAIDLTDMEFVDANLGNLPPNGFDAAVKFTEKILGPGSKELTSGEIFDLAEFLWQTGKWASKKLEDRKLASMESADTDPLAVGYNDANGTPMTVSEAAATIKPYEFGSNENHVYFTTNSDTAVTNPYEDETGNSIAEPPIGEAQKSKIMKYWSNAGVLPSVVESALAVFDEANPGHTYKPDTKLWNTEGLMDKIGTLGMTLDDVVYDMGVPAKIDVSTKNGEITITKTGPGEYTYDAGPKNFAIGPLDSVLKAAAEYLKKPSQAADNDAKAQKQAMEFLNDMLLDEPVTIDGNTWELEGVWDGDEVTSAVVKLNGIPVSNQIPFEPETATPTLGPKGIYDEYFALDWMKDWKAPEAKPLLSPEQDKTMVAASELVAALSGGYISQPEVTIGDKTFWAKINEQGNMTLFGVGKGGWLTGAYPIQGSKTMDPIDLEAAVYEGLTVLGAKTAPQPKTPTAKMPTETELNEAADELLNAGDGDSVTVGGYEFQTVLGGQGGAAVNILPEGTRDIIDTFYYDASDFDNPSDLLDVLHINLKQFFQNNSDEGPSSGAAKFMPAGEGISPKTLYNFYHLATLESQGRIKSEYGQGLMREYLDSYKQRYLDTLGPLVADQIKKYIDRGRVDEGVTDEVLEAAANDPVLLDELMRQTYRSDMKRRNDVWNNITEHLRGLEAARTPKDIIFRIDRLNNAIHNTNELLFTKFKNAGELMDAFESIHNARDERAYARNVDRDLRQIEEFEGGSGPARFMPDVANVEDLASAVASIISVRNVRDERAKKWLHEAYRKNFAGLDLSEGLQRANLSGYRAKKGDPDWMRKPGLQRFNSLKTVEKDRLGHIADYLNTLNDRELGKLSKQTLTDVEKKVAEWDKMLQKKMGEKAKFVKEGEDIETLETFKDGFSIARLVSKGAYEDEGKCMGHCVGGYDPTDENRTILSLRGPDGESHATLELIKDLEEFAAEEIETVSQEAYEWDEMEGDLDGRQEEDYQSTAENLFLEEYNLSSLEEISVLNQQVQKENGGFVVQIKGKANKPPKKSYADRIVQFLKNNPSKYVVLAEGENIGLEPRPKTEVPKTSQNLPATVEEKSSPKDERNIVARYSDMHREDRRMSDGEWSDYKKFLRKYKLSLRDWILTRRKILEKYPENLEPESEAAENRVKEVEKIFGIPSTERAEFRDMSLGEDVWGTIDAAEEASLAIILDILHDEYGFLPQDSVGKKTDSPGKKIFSPESNNFSVYRLPEEDKKLLLEEFISGKIYSDDSEFVKKYNSSKNLELGPSRFMPSGSNRQTLARQVIKDAESGAKKNLVGTGAWLTSRGWIPVSDHLDIFPLELSDLRSVGYEDLMKAGAVRVRREGKTLYYEGYPSQKILKELKDTAIEKKLNLEPVPTASQIGEMMSNARFMPAEARGAFYHGTDKRRSTRLGPRGGEFYGQWEGDAVRVTYLSPEFEEAERFGENVLEGKLKNRNIFDPTDEEDIERVVRTALELGPDTSAIVEEAKTDPEAAKELKFIERGIRRDIAGGKDKRDGWRSVESYAGAIKAAGFDGYVAWEGGSAAVGMFPDRVDLRSFEWGKSGIGEYDKFPRGSVRSRGSGNIQFMPGNAPDSSQVDPGLAGVTVPNVDRGPLSGARFMPGYNPRYTKDDGSFDREAWLNDRRRAEAELRRRGLSRRDFYDNDEYEQAIRDLLREPTRG